VSWPGLASWVHLQQKEGRNNGRICNKNRGESATKGGVHEQHKKEGRNEGGAADIGCLVVASGHRLTVGHQRLTTHLQLAGDQARHTGSS